MKAEPPLTMERTTSSVIEARPLKSLDPSKMREKSRDVEEEKKREEHKRRSKNWTRVEILKMIRFRSAMETRFLMNSKKAELWIEISEALRSEGICRDAQQCRDKWEKLIAGYKEVRDGARAKEDYPFFEDLDHLLSSKSQRRETETRRIELQREIKLIRSDGEETEDATDFPAQKRRKKCRDSELETIDEALKDLLDTVIARQDRFFVDLLESMDRREKIREKMRQEREEKWREEDRVERLEFQNAMILLTKKLVNEGRERRVFPETSSVGVGMKKRSKNWKRGEVLMLIKLRAEMEVRFAKSTRRAKLWEEVARLMCAKGVKRDGKQCREKWDKLMAECKEVSEGKREPGDSPYFADILSITRASPTCQAPLNTTTTTTTGTAVVE